MAAFIYSLISVVLCRAKRPLHMLQRTHGGTLHEARPQIRRPRRGRRRRRRLRAPDLRQLVLGEGRPERHPAGVALPGGRQRPEGQGRRLRGRRLREGPQGHQGRRRVHPHRHPRPARQGCLQRPEVRARRHGVRQHRHRRLCEGRRTPRRHQGVRRLERGEGHRPDREAVRHGRRQAVRLPVLRRRPRPVLPHRRLQGPGPPTPKTMAELASTARKIHKAKSDLYGLVVGGAYTYGAMPFVWANGGELATADGVRTPPASTAPPPRRASRRTPRCSPATTVPPPSAR